MFSCFCMHSSLVIILIYDNAWSHVAKMRMLGHMLPGGQCSAACCQDDTTVAHWFRIWDFSTSTIFSWSLTYQLTFFQAFGHFSMPKDIPFQRTGKNFLASLEFYRTGINNLVNRWQKCIDAQGSWLIKILIKSIKK